MQYTWMLLSVHVFVASGKLVRVCVSLCVCSEMQMTVKDGVMHDSLTTDLHLCPEYEDKWLC